MNYSNKTLVPIERNAKRVLTTKQLAEVYEANEQQIQQNYNNHEDQFKEGVHYILLKGAELKEFKRCFDNIEEALGISKFTSQLYLWTERGASRHCKILDTPKAWEQFDNLEETYFAVKGQREKWPLPPDYSSALRALADEVDRNEALSAEKERLQIELDGSQEWLSIKRVAAINAMSYKALNWRSLKTAGEAMGYGTRKIWDANYGSVNVYHRNVWTAVYPEYRLEEEKHA